MSRLSVRNRVCYDCVQVTEYIADHLGYKEANLRVMHCVFVLWGQFATPASAFRGEVPVCLDPTWFRQPGPLVVDAKYRPHDCMVP